MADFIVICLLIFLILLLLIALGLSYRSQKKQQYRIQQISNKLSDILNKDTDEKVMVFTADKSLMKLMTQINRILEDRQRIHADYQRSEAASKRMLSNISHDIKTPLTVILGYLEILLINSQSKDTATLRKVENKAKQVMELINKFFTLAKIEAGDMEIEIARINISEIFKENVADFYNILTEKEFKVDICFPESDAYVYGNEEALNRILSNLISNAIRYGRDGKYLGIALRTDEEFVWIDITDHGQGIDKAMAANVFDRLYRMDDSRSTQDGGSGLGLAIAKELAVKLNGDILLESEPGIKTVFTVKLKRMIY